MIFLIPFKPKAQLRVERDFSQIPSPAPAPLPAPSRGASPHCSHQGGNALNLHTQQIHTQKGMGLGGCGCGLLLETPQETRTAPGDRLHEERGFWKRPRDPRRNPRLTPAKSPGVSVATLGALYQEGCSLSGGCCLYASRIQIQTPDGKPFEVNGEVGEWATFSLPELED